jgi:hypothetical protein
MKRKSDFATISRRDAIRLIAATPASGAMLVGSLPIAASAGTSPPSAVARHIGPAAADRRAKSLAQLAAKHFEPLVGEKFTVGGEEVTLSEVRRGPKSGARYRQQFALTFTAPQTLPMKAGIVPVSHPAIGRHDLHVTTIDGSALEICFS